MAKYQKYAEYKDSGVEWLGDLPNHWEIKKLVWFFSAEKGKNGQLLTKEYCGLNTGEFPVYSGQTENNGIMGSINSYEFDVGDNGVLFSTTVGAKAMTLSYLQGKFSLSQNCMIIKPRKNNINTRFYYYHCQPLFAKERALIPEHMQASFRVEDLYSYRISLPPIIEQVQIANFLDYETAKIDSLIDKQEQLIELLKEKRQAVISHAVTKGLDPNVPMKDSGVEWLGQVPEHWISSRLKYYTNQIVDGAHFTPTYSESGIPFLRVTDIHNAAIDMENIKYIPEHEHFDLIQRCKPEKGDLLLSKNGTIGVPKLIDWEWKFSIFVSLCLIKFKKNLKAEFAEYFFKSYEIQEQIFGLIKKSTVINLHLDKIQNFWFSIPSVDEQIEIVNFLNHKTNELDNLISKAELAIQLMQERRTALISAAVTGKIDVRNWQNPTEARTEFSA